MTDATLSPHFHASEFDSGDGARMPPAVLYRLMRLARVLEKIREHFGGHPVTIHSGYRSKAHNKAVGGVADSQHLYGAAADISIPGVSPRAIGAFAVTIQDIGGVGIYEGQGFCHIDIRMRSGGPCARWEG